MGHALLVSFKSEAVSCCDENIFEKIPLELKLTAARISYLKGYFIRFSNIIYLDHF